MCNAYFKVVSKTYVLFGYLFYSDDNVYSNHLSCLFYALLPPKICLTFRSVAATTKPKATRFAAQSLIHVFILRLAGPAFLFLFLHCKLHLKCKSKPGDYRE